MSDRPDVPSPDGAGSLQEVKQRVRGKYLGRFGIHGVGARSSENTIRVYASAGDPDQEAGLQEIRQEIAPYKLDVILEDGPSVRPAT